MAFQKFMNKKDFHPGSLRNIKMVWEAEQKKTAAEKREKEMKELYEKEQERYRTRQYITDSNESAKLSLNFMYEAPPGMKKEDKEDEEPKLELKFDWQKQIPEGKQAPRESYAKDLDIKDKPFGIEVRNVHCIKCGKWGHINTDKICPLFGKSKEDLFVPTGDPTLLMREMRKDGLAIKRNAMGRQVDPHANNQQMIASSDEEDDPEIAFLKSLSRKDKMKLLKKLDKQEREQEGKKPVKRKKKKKSSEKKEKSRKLKKTAKHGKTKTVHSTSESSSTSENESDSDVAFRRRHDSDDDEDNVSLGGRNSQGNSRECRYRKSVEQRMRKSRSPYRKGTDSLTTSVRRKESRSNSPTREDTLTSRKSHLRCSRTSSRSTSRSPAKRKRSSLDTCRKKRRSRSQSLERKGRSISEKSKASKRSPVRTSSDDNRRNSLSGSSRRKSLSTSSEKHGRKSSRSPIRQSRREAHRRREYRRSHSQDR